jgi:endonuclease/exonuclease/phosphatase family metal-dependent hydrolase
MIYSNVYKPALILLFTALFISVKAQLDKNKKYQVATVAFYNLENLFDTIIDPDTNLILREDFTPNAPKHWNSKRYWEKLDRMAYVISQLGAEVNPDGPQVLGVAEVENKNVLQDLAKQPKLKKMHYGIVHYDSPDHRGIDVGLLYNKKRFNVLYSRPYRLKIPEDSTFTTRDLLYVKGVLDDSDTLHFIVAHWPSRRGGQKRSEPKRIAAAKLSRSVIDSILNTNPEAKVIFMGDLNDDPNNKSMVKYMQAREHKEEVTDGALFNPMIGFYKKGIGTLAYRDNWNLFDQFVLTPGLLKEDYSTYRFFKANVFNKEFLKQQEGAFKGYPKRTYVGTNYLGGYSDHFPVYLFLIKEKH